MDYRLWYFVLDMITYKWYNVLGSKTELISEYYAHSFLNISGWICGRNDEESLSE